jgi:hypothetical protein
MCWGNSGTRVWTTPTRAHRDTGREAQRYAYVKWNSGAEREQQTRVPPDDLRDVGAGATEKTKNQGISRCAREAPKSVGIGRASEGGKRASTSGAAAGAPRRACGWGRRAHPPWLRHSHKHVSDAGGNSTTTDSPVNGARAGGEGRRRGTDLCRHWRSAGLPWLRTAAAGARAHAGERRGRGIFEREVGCLAWGRGRGHWDCFGLAARPPGFRLLHGLWRCTASCFSTRTALRASGFTHLLFFPKPLPFT